MSKITAIVTGGGRGIGRAIVDRLVQDGMQVLTCGRSARPSNLPAAVAWVQADVATSAGTAAIMAAAHASFGLGCCVGQ